MPPYLFPLLDFNKIADTLREYVPDLTVDHLRRPTPDIARMLYITVCTEVWRIKYDGDPTMMPIEVSSMLSNVELHETNSRNLMLLNSMRDLQKLILCNEITIKDLIKPEPKRMQNILSAFINFMFFMRERFDPLDDLESKKAEAVERRDRAQRLCQEQLAQLEEHKARADALTPEVFKIMSEVEKEREIKEALMNDARQVQEVYKRKKTELKNIQQERLEVTREVERLQAQHSDIKERIQPSLATLNSEEDHASDVCREQAALLEELKEEELRAHAKISTFTEASEVQESLQKRMKPLVETYKERKTVRRALEAAEEEQAASMSAQRSSRAQLEAGQRQLGLVQDKLSRVQLQHQAAMLPKRQQLEQLTGDMAAEGGEHGAELQELIERAASLEMEHGRASAALRDRTQRLVKLTSDTRVKQTKNEQIFFETKKNLIDHVTTEFDKENEFNAQNNAKIKNMTERMTNLVDGLRRTQEDSA